MKTAIYIEDGVVQLVITPESDFEKNAIGSFSKSQVETKIMEGQFYKCMGGWYRQADTTTDKSLIIQTAVTLNMGEVE